MVKTRMMFVFVLVLHAVGGELVSGVPISGFPPVFDMLVETDESMALEWTKAWLKMEDNIFVEDPLVHNQSNGNTTRAEKKLSRNETARGAGEADNGRNLGTMSDFVGSDVSWTHAITVGFVAKNPAAYLAVSAAVIIDMVATSQNLIARVESKLGALMDATRITINDADVSITEAQKLRADAKMAGLVARRKDLKESYDDLLESQRRGVALNLLWKRIKLCQKYFLNENRKVFAEPLEEVENYKKVRASILLISDGFEAVEKETDGLAMKWKNLRAKFIDLKSDADDMAEEARSALDKSKKKSDEETAKYEEAKLAANRAGSSYKNWVKTKRAEVYGGAAACVAFPLSCPAVYATCAGILESAVQAYGHEVDEKVNHARLAEQRAVAAYNNAMRERGYHLALVSKLTKFSLEVEQYADDCLRQADNLERFLINVKDFSKNVQACEKKIKDVFEEVFGPGMSLGAEISEELEGKTDCPEGKDLIIQMKAPFVELEKTVSFLVGESTRRLTLV